MQLQHLVEVILVHVRGGVAGCCILTSSCCPGGGMVARTESGSLKQWSMEGFEQADVGCVVVGSDSPHLTRVTSDGIS